MQIQILSDIHLEFHKDFNNLPQISPLADVILLAGDICTEPHQYRLFLKHCRRVTTKPIISVLGNHEFYGNNFNFAVNEYRAVLQDIPDFHLLEDSFVDINDLRIVGSTLWTDFDKGREIFSAIIGMTDFRTIEFDLSSTEIDLAHAMMSRHKNSVEFIRKTLQNSNDKRTIVLTHHCPSYLSIHPNYKGSRLNSSFTSNLSDLILDESPDIWVSGHVHNHFDYNIGKTRIIHNPFGYPFESGKSGYVENFAVEI